MGRIVELAPEAFVERLLARGQRRAWIRTDPQSGRVRASTPVLEELADYVEGQTDPERRHEAVFLGVGLETRALFGVFVHRTQRGQAQGGVRHWPYPTMASFLRDGLRLSRGMSRKCALADLWWGGGKALISRLPGDGWRDTDVRRKIYAELGDFVSSLCGVYVTAEDVGTTPLDMVEVHRHTRFATCLPTEIGGSGNPSLMTARGVVCAMEGALDFLERGSLRGAKVVMEGAGNVGACMIDELLERGVREIVATEICEERTAALQDRYADRPVRVMRVEPGDHRILAEPCDVLAPNALGGVLGPKTVPDVQARVVCGAANNALSDETRDARLLAERGILFVPDFLANRMGIVACSNEQYGSVPGDPDLARHLGRDWPGSVYNRTREVLARARAEGTTPVAAANAMADRKSDELHPIFGDRARRIIEGLVSEGWERG
ncbi:MAG: valine dehydrogenase [Proteobacteria bacterium]|nr:valine dehydrogenase [Pseudomonadota bacterium]